MILNFNNERSSDIGYQSGQARFTTKLPETNGYCFPVSYILSPIISTVPPLTWNCLSLDTMTVNRKSPSSC
jgi:hypothetical protein